MHSKLFATRQDIGGPDPQAALQQYQRRAAGYDAELALFEPLRREAVRLLALQPGQRVLDVGCGTGLSFAPLKAVLGQSGSIVGIEQCPEMLERAKARVSANGWKHIALVQAPAAEARIDGLADAALFHFTHDILQQPPAIEHVLGHLKPGARVVATGLQWASPWVWPVNLFVWGAALYSVSTLEGLAKPWACLSQALPGLEVQPAWMPGVGMVRGVWQGRPAKPLREPSVGHAPRKVTGASARGVH